LEDERLFFSGIDQHDGAFFEAGFGAQNGVQEKIGYENDGKH
jgi:hypothetical protein